MSNKKKSHYIPYIAAIILFFVSCIGKMHAQIITTVAGNGVAGYSGDGGQAISAEFNMTSIVFDTLGNLYVGDGINNRVRIINTFSIVTTFAGNGIPGFFGDGGAAIAAELNNTGVGAIDGFGNNYISDGANNRIRKVDAAGIITTFAGNGTPGYIGDGGSATAAELLNTGAEACDIRGNVYLRGLHIIRKVDALGIITTIAGSTLGFSGDGGPATAAHLNSPSGMGLDNFGNMYIADMINQRIRKIDTSGIITTIAGSGGTGTGAGGFSGDGGPATDARFNYPCDVKVDKKGNIYVADINNKRIRKIDTAGTISTIAGNGTAGFYGDGAPATSAELNGAGSIAFDCSGNLFIRDYGNNRIRVVMLQHPPQFSVGHILRDTVCNNITTPVNELLAVTDSDIGQTATWSAALPPAHGTAVAAYSMGTTGGMLTPAGLTYTPASGYVGDDSFKVRISDCGFLTDSATVYVSVVSCALASLGLSTGGEEVLRVAPNPNDGTFVFNVSSTTDEDVRVVVSNMVGEKVKEINTTTNKATEMKLDAPAGVYFLSAGTKEGRYNVKVISQ